MPFNGSGVFSIVNTFVPGTTIFSSAVNANFTDIATGLSSCMLKDGSQTITANIPMSGFGFTGVGSIGSQAVITVASAATCDILSQASLLIAISGVVPVTSFGADAASRRNQIKFVRATGAFTLTHNATSLILPTSANITCADGDTFVVISDASSNARVYAYQRKSGYAVIAYPGFRNIARRNGGLEVWQRGAGGAASIAVAASGGSPYTADGWYLLTSANQASVVAQSAGITDGSQWCAKVQRNNGQTGTTVMQFCFPLDTDELYPMLGQFVRYSLTMKAGANWSPASGAITYRLVVGTGTPVKQSLGTYTSLTGPIATTVNLTTTATRYQTSSSAIIPTTTRQAEIQVFWTPVGTASADDSFYIDDVQLEIVPDASQGASPFEQLIFQEQLALCKRHYQKSFPYAIAPVTNGGVLYSIQWFAIGTSQPISFQWVLPIDLRLATGGTGTLYNAGAANAQIRNVTDGVDFSASAITLVSNNVLTISGTKNAGLGAEDLVAVNAQIDAGI